MVIKSINISSISLHYFVLYKVFFTVAWLRNIFRRTEETTYEFFRQPVNILKLDVRLSNWNTCYYCEFNEKGFR